MSSSATAPDSSVIGGNVKQAKFDRQLRLWGADGQAALEAAHVVALGATPAIAEALKSLVLTGVPTITLVDERVVSDADAGASYFVPASSIGASMASAVLQTVCPLGEQCRGFAAVMSPEAWVKEFTDAVEHDWRAGCLCGTSSSSPLSASAMTRGHAEEMAACASSSTTNDISAVRKFMAGFAAAAVDPASNTASCSSPSIAAAAPSLILVSDRYTDLSPLSPLVQTCRTRSYPDVPVMLVRSSGWLGFVQVHCSPRVVLRPQNPTQVKMEDLRIFEPFPALQEWFDTHDPDDEQQFPTTDADAMSLHSHLPYPCILYHAYRRWWSSLPGEAQHALQQRHAEAATDFSPSSIFPLTAKEYRSMGDVVAAMIRRQSPPEEAFVEAMERCTPKLNRPVVQQLPEGLRVLLDDPRCAAPVLAVAAMETRLAPAATASLHQQQQQRVANIGSAYVSAEHVLRVWASPDVLVWFVLHAVRLFLAGDIGHEGHRVEGTASQESPSPAQHTAEQTTRLPVHTARYHMPFAGYLPDFTTTTKWYRELQDIYNAKHHADVACIAAKAWELMMAALTTRMEGTNSNNISNNGGDEGASESEAVTAALILEMQVGSALRPLLNDCAATVVANIWDLRGVVFSVGYAAAGEAEWRACLGKRLIWITHHIAYDVNFSAASRRAACLAVAYLSREELERRARVATPIRCTEAGEASRDVITGADILAEFQQLTSLVPSSVMCTPEEDNESTDKTRDRSELRLPTWLMEDSSGHELLTKACAEVARWVSRGGGAVQLPSVAASTGALAAQEAVKLVMHIRIPCGQPMMYDGYTNKVFTL